MDKQFCGKSVPTIGLGCMGMSEFYGQSDDQSSINLLLDAFEKGYRHFDTADMYGRGHNEQLLSKFISKLSIQQRDSIVIASKVGIVRDSVEKYSVSFNNSREYIKKACEDSLKRLNVDYLDLYYLHRLAPNQDVEEVISTFIELKNEGKIKGIGLCETDAETLKIAHNLHPIAALQSEYSLWSRDVETSVLPMCESLSIPLVAFSPLGRGFLAGSVTKASMSSAQESEDLRTRLPRFNGENLDHNMILVEKMDEIALQLNISKSQLALAWLLAQSDCIHIIPGTRTPKYLLDNFSSKNIQLGSDIINKLSELFVPDAICGDRYPGKLKPR